MPSIVSREGFQMGRISDSETKSFQTCQRKHYYTYGLRLQPRRMSDGLTRGIVGHEVLAEYYSALADRKDHAAAVDAANSRMASFIQKAADTGLDVILFTDLQKRLQDYYEWSYANERGAFRFQEVEQAYRLTLPGGLQYVMRLDLLAESISGPYAGQLVLIDHKFVWDFYSEDEVAMNSQLPKYLGILAANDVPVRIAYLNMIRTRVNKKPMAIADKFRRAVVKPTPEEIQTIFLEELKVAEQIEFFRSLSLEQWESEITRSMTPMNCKTCPFAILCKADLQGQDTRLMRQVEFEPRPVNEAMEVKQA
mgnify:CR=1 FL=1